MKSRFSLVTDLFQQACILHQVQMIILTVWFKPYIMLQFLKKITNQLKSKPQISTLQVLILDSVYELLNDAC